MIGAENHYQHAEHYFGSISSDRGTRWETSPRPPGRLLCLASIWARNLAVRRALTGRERYPARVRGPYRRARREALARNPKILCQILQWPHREVVWVIFGQISSGCLLLLLPLWACGQRTCVVHHVHSDVGRAAYSIRGSVTSPCPALGPTGASRTRMQRPRTATRPEACR